MPPAKSVASRKQLVGKMPRGNRDLDALLKSITPGLCTDEPSRRRTSIHEQMPNASEKPAALEKGNAPGRARNKANSQPASTKPFRKEVPPVPIAAEAPKEKVAPKNEPKIIRKRVVNPEISGPPLVWENGQESGVAVAKSEKCTGKIDPAKPNSAAGRIGRVLPGRSARIKTTVGASASDISNNRIMRRSPSPKRPSPEPANASSTKMPKPANCRTNNGRDAIIPTSSDSVSKDTNVSNATTDITAPVIKRGRGRPRKDGNSSAATKKDESVLPPPVVKPSLVNDELPKVVKRGRGRPPKKDTTTIVASKASSIEPPELPDSNVVPEICAPVPVAKVPVGPKKAAAAVEANDIDEVSCKVPKRSISPNPVVEVGRAKPGRATRAKARELRSAVVVAPPTDQKKQPASTSTQPITPPLEFIDDDKIPIVPEKNFLLRGMFNNSATISNTHRLLSLDAVDKTKLADREDFRLPFDLWVLSLNRKRVKMIKTNIYNSDVKLPKILPESCECIDGCLPETCENRICFIECFECPSGKSCLNQRIQRNDVAVGLKKFSTEKAGIGVKTSRRIKKGDYLGEYCGQVITTSEFTKLMASTYALEKNHYCLNLDKGLLVDAYRCGSLARYVNHSCEPNAEMQKWNVLGRPRMCLFAVRDIKTGEEITYDYKFANFNNENAQQCYCGAENCRGIIGRAPSKCFTRTGRNGFGFDIAAYRSQWAGRMPNRSEEQSFISNGHILLLRNLKAVLRIVDTPRRCNLSSNVRTQIKALSAPRNVRTRALGVAENDEMAAHSVQMLMFFQQIFTSLTMHSQSGTNGALSAPLMRLPSPKAMPRLYEEITTTNDLASVEKKMQSCSYASFDEFNSDILDVFENLFVWSELDSTKTVKAGDIDDLLMRYRELLAQNSTAIPPFVSSRVVGCRCGLRNETSDMLQCCLCQLYSHRRCCANGSLKFICDTCRHKNTFTSLPKSLSILMETPTYSDALADTNYYVSYVNQNGTNVHVQGVYVVDRRTINLYKFDQYFGLFYVERIFEEQSAKGVRLMVLGRHLLFPFETKLHRSGRFRLNEVILSDMSQSLPIDLLYDEVCCLDVTSSMLGHPNSFKCVFVVDRVLTNDGRRLKSIATPLAPISYNERYFNFLTEKHDISESISESFYNAKECMQYVNNLSLDQFVTKRGSRKFAMKDLANGDVSATKTSRKEKLSSIISLLSTNASKCGEAMFGDASSDGKEVEESSTPPNGVIVPSVTVMETPQVLGRRTPSPDLFSNSISPIVASTPLHSESKDSSNASSTSSDNVATPSSSTVNNKKRSSASSSNSSSRRVSKSRLSDMRDVNETIRYLVDETLKIEAISVAARVATLMSTPAAPAVAPPPLKTPSYANDIPSNTSAPDITLFFTPRSEVTLVNGDSSSAFVTAIAGADNSRLSTTLLPEFSFLNEVLSPPIMRSCIEK